MSDEELLNLILTKAKELKRTPKKREVEHYNIIAKRFGSWNSAIEKAGLTVTKRVNYTEEQLIDFIKNKAKELGRVPRKEDFTNIDTITSHFGTFTNAIRKAGMVPGIRTEEELLNQLKALSETLGRTPSIAAAEANGLPSAIFAVRFGSWNNAIEKARLNIKFCRTNVTETNEELIEQYINLCNKLNRLATTRDLDKDEATYNKNVFENRFESITKLKELVINDSRLKISDKSYVEASQKYSIEQLENILLTILKENNYKRLSEKRLKKKLQNDKLPSLNTFYKRFNTTKILELWSRLDSILNELALKQYLNVLQGEGGRKFFPLLAEAQKRYILKYLFENILGYSKNDIVSRITSKDLVHHKILWIFGYPPKKLDYFIKFTYPGEFDDLDEFMVPKNYWTAEHLINSIKNLIDKNFESDEQIIEKFNAEFLKDNNMLTQLFMFDGSPFKMLDTAYPGRFKPWQFKKVPHGYWTIENTKMAMEWLVYEKLGMTLEEAKKKIRQKDFKKYGLGGLLFKKCKTIDNALSYLE